MDVDELIFMADEEQQERYCRYMENSTPYNSDIIAIAKSIIDNKNYSNLSEILKNYDNLVKEKYGYATDLELPYWSYSLGFCGKMED